LKLVALSESLAPCAKIFHRQGAKSAKGAKEKQFSCCCFGLSLPWRSWRPLRLGGENFLCANQPRQSEVRKAPQGAFP
jgi:hypothetical protein